MIWDFDNSEEELLAEIYSHYETILTDNGYQRETETCWAAHTTGKFYNSSLSLTNLGTNSSIYQTFYLWKYVLGIFALSGLFLVTNGNGLNWIIMCFSKLAWHIQIFMSKNVDYIQQIWNIFSVHKPGFFLYPMKFAKIESVNTKCMLHVAVSIWKMEAQVCLSKRIQINTIDQYSWQHVRKAWVFTFLETRSSKNFKNSGLYWRGQFI